LGVGLLVSSRANSATRVDLVGAVILVLASGSWAWGSVWSKTAPLPKSPFLATSMEMIGGGLLLLLAAGIAGQFHAFEPSRVTLGAALSWWYLVIFGSLVGFTAYIWLLRHCDPSKVATYAYVNPVVAVLLGALFAGETPTFRTAVAAAIIIGSVAVVITAQQAGEKISLLSRPQLHNGSETS